jgi:large subunit ribosomal protein L31
MAAGRFRRILDATHTSPAGAGRRARGIALTMKNIHPRYKPVTVSCVGCGAKYETRSTKGKDFNIDVCSHCHPFFTGRQKFVDSAGRVERFQKKFAAVQTKKDAKAATKVEKTDAAPADGKK